MQDIADQPAYPLITSPCKREGSACTCGIGISLQTRGLEPSPLAVFLYRYSLFHPSDEAFSNLPTALL
jgi:hypothetical protein